MDGRTSNDPKATTPHMPIPALGCYHTIALHTSGHLYTRCHLGALAALLIVC